MLYLIWFKPYLFIFLKNSDGEKMAKNFYEVDKCINMANFLLENGYNIEEVDKFSEVRLEKEVQNLLERLREQREDFDF